MKRIVPDYYPQFHCIADRCQHSCCIGWEIDIDEDSLSQYKTIDGDLGKRLKENIVVEDNCAHFQLTADERCPFLNQTGLCDLICALGEDSLCQICADHPRFRNEFSAFEEMGLGLCCEEAARLVLTKPDKTTLLMLDDSGEDDELYEDEIDVLSVRKNAIAIVQDREFTIEERMENLSDFFGVVLPEHTPHEWAEIYLDLERLDESWTDALHTLTDNVPTLEASSEWETAFEQLLVYFLYRHLPAALNDGDVYTKIGFALLSVTLIRWLLAEMEQPTLSDLIDLVRMYSGEIEYSDENLDILFDCIAEESI